MAETNARTRAAKIIAAHDQRLAAIRADGRLSADARQRMIAASLHRTRQAMAQLKNDDDAEKATRLQSLEEEVHAYPLDRVAYRGVLEHVADMEDPKHVSEALDRGLRTGDALLAHAAFSVAAQRSSTEWGYQGVVDTYVSRNPAAGEALRELREHEADADSRLERVFSPFRVAHPPELPRDDAEIARLAGEAAAMATAVPAAADGRGLEVLYDDRR